MLKTQEPIRRPLPGVALKIALGVGGAVSILIRDDRQNHQLMGFDLSGQELFSTPLTYNPRTIRLSSDHAIWVGLPSGLQQYDSSGKLLRTLNLQRRENENVGSFLLLNDGFIVALQNESTRKAEGRLLRLDRQGNILWTTVITPGAITYDGVVQMSPKSDWRPRPAPAWRPRNWVSYYHQPLLVNGDTLLVHFCDHPSTGIGVIYALDFNSGAIGWATEPRPYETKAIAGPGSFLISAQGYGAFDTWLYDSRGGVRQHWHSHGNFLLTEEGEIRVVEMENILPSRVHFVVLHPGGEVQRGPQLPGYYTSYPVVDREGNTAFWRYGDLIRINRRMEMQVLASENDYPPYAFPTRMLLTEEGRLIFALEDQLRIYQTDLAPLAHSPWPCGEGSLLGNPALEG